MTIGVPFQLRRRTGAGPVVALFVPGHDLTALFAICTRLGLDPARRVFDLADGYLLQLAGATTWPFPGATRLRALAPAFYLPADAELIPALLDDEASGLVRDWGLVLLPDNRALWFDRHSPAESTDMLTAPLRAKRVWASLPPPRRIADRLTQIALDLPEEPPEALYRAYRDELERTGSHANPAESKDESHKGEDARTAEASSSGEAEAEAHADEDSSPTGGEVAQGLRADAAAHLRHLLHAISGSFSRGGQALGALKEKLQWEWIDHSALVRKLVREFRQGDTERALRRAIPIIGATQPAVPVNANWLPWHRAIYKLADLLRRPARGEAIAVRLAREDVVRELEREYRKAAERATRQGDFRRAAYIYGMLLRDDRMAANALQRGGLHHDAAILYLKKLGDPAAAAQAYEAAGEVDRAIALYRQVGEHESAGDLLRRLGEEDAAVAEYVRAAGLYTALTPPAYHCSGLLLENKARLPDLALECFQKGWDARPMVDATGCAFELARIHAERACVEPIRTLLDQADAFFASSGSEQEAGLFYNGIVKVTNTPAIGLFVEEVRDRALLALAARLRQNAERGRSPASLVSTFLGGSALWPAAVQSDAEFAVSEVQRRRRALQAAPHRDPRIHGVRIGSGTVTAAVSAPITGELFLGFDNGAVFGYRPGPVEVVQIADAAHPVTALAVDPEGKTVVALRQCGRGSVLSCSSRCADGSFRCRPQNHIPALSESWLTPIVPWGVERLIGLGDGHDLLIVDATSGMHWARLTLSSESANPPTTALLLPIGPESGTSPARLLVLTHDGPNWVVLDAQGGIVHPTPYHWQPSTPNSSTLRSLPLTWRHVPPFVELVGLDKNGAIHAAQFYLDADSLELLAARLATTEGGYLAAARSGTSTVIAVSRTHIDWLSYSADRFRIAQTLKLVLPSAVACFSSPASHEELVVCSDGFVARVSAPRRANTTAHE